MKQSRVRRSVPLSILVIVAIVVFSTALPGQRQAQDEDPILKAFHSISSHTLYGYVEELVSEKYGGRLTGTEEYDACTEWVAGLFKKWGVAPAGDEGTYFQSFPNPYTLVFPDCEVSLHLPQMHTDEAVKKTYRFDDEFIPGSTSGSGEITAEVIYVGYGITAPELGFDEYQGVDVKGKIVLMEREAPVSPGADPEVFKKWRPYSFHQYKLKNAVAHGAKGMIYNYGPIGNPNNAYEKEFIYSHVGPAVVNDVFAGTGKNHRDVVKTIQSSLKPQSFNTGKVVTIRNTTEHFPNGIGRNVVGMIEGSDPALKDEIIMLGGHLDHLGRCYALMPGANDNATAVAVTLGVARAMAECVVKPKRTVVFMLFGAEEQAVAGSDFYVNQSPLFPLDKTIMYINMEGPGSGDKISVSAGENFPEFTKFLEKANQDYIHRSMRSRFNANLGRPRQDIAWFLWKDVPAVTVGSYGYNPGRPTYHNTWDNLDLVTEEIMEDIAQLLFMAIMDMSDEPALDFR